MRFVLGLLLTIPCLIFPHTLKQMWILDNSDYAFEFYDGSVWRTDRSEGEKALNWRVNDTIRLTQNTSPSWFFTDYQYQLINKSDGMPVKVDLMIGPSLDNELSRFVVCFNYYADELLLSNGSWWRICDADDISDWRIYDYIIVGINSNETFWDPFCEALLINVSQKSQARAHLYYGSH